MIETCGRCHWGIQTSVRISINGYGSVTDLVFSFSLKTTELMSYIHTHVYMCICYTQCIYSCMYIYTYVYKYTWFKYISGFYIFPLKSKKFFLLSSVNMTSWLSKICCLIYLNK